MNRAHIFDDKTGLRMLGLLVTTGGEASYSRSLTQSPEQPIPSSSPILK
jgi:hypothetical protein